MFFLLAVVKRAFFLIILCVCACVCVDAAFRNSTGLHISLKQEKIGFFFASFSEYIHAQ